jgi:hypothetical protein
LLSLVAGAQPSGVVGDGSLGVELRLVAGVLPDPAEVQVNVAVRPVRVAAVRQAGPRAGIVFFIAAARSW